MSSWEVTVLAILSTIVTPSCTYETSNGGCCHLPHYGKEILAWNLEWPSVAMQLEEHCGSVNEKTLFQCYVCESIERAPPPRNHLPHGWWRSPSKIKSKGHVNIDLLPMDDCGINYRSKDTPDYSDSGLLENPWMVMLFRTSEPDSEPKLYRAGSGTLINNRYVITSARCVTMYEANIARVGEHDLREEIECEIFPGDGLEVEVCYPPAKDIFIDRWILHPEYNWKTIESSPNDIALLMLSEIIPYFHETVRPICLPIQLEQQTEDLIGKAVEVVGWGKNKLCKSKFDNGELSSALQKYKATVLENENCDFFLKDTSTMNDHSLICTIGNFVGDYGAPLTHIITVEGTDRTLLRGIYNNGPEECVLGNNTSVFVDVGHHIKWILDNMEE